MQKVVCRGAALILIVSLMIVTWSAPVFAATTFSQGFETDTSGWDIGTSGSPNNAVRVASGTDGIPSATGDFHAEAVLGSINDDGSALTRWGGYESAFPTGGYSTSVAIYLNVDGGYANDTRFDWDSSINDASGNFRRDFIFNAGFYNDSDTTGTGNRFVVTASNGGGRANSFPKNPDRSPFAITTTGWYTFTHHFYDSGTGNILAVDLSIADSSGTTLHTWTLSDPSDVIGTTVGGHRYGWFDNNEFTYLAIDDSKLGPSDAIAPVTVASAVNADSTPYTFGTWTNQRVTVSLSASDTGGSGLAATFYTINSGTTQTYSGPISFTNDGTYVLSFWSTDVAGNSETPQTVTIDIVRTNAGLIALTNQFEGNSRYARQLTAALQFAGLGERIHNDRLASIGLTLYIYEVNQQRGRTLTNAEANTLISLAESF